MTGTISPDTPSDSVPQPDPAGEQFGELLRVDPRSLIIGANARTDPRLNPDFVRSIADRGVREPINVRRDPEGRLVVRKGQRRTLAAIQTGLETVLVFVEPHGEGGQPDEAERIIDQLEENRHRVGTTDAEDVHAHQQLLDLGLTAGQIARRTHTPPQRVRITTTVARSQAAAAVLARYELTLDQAAIIAEFDKDTEAVKLLTVTATKQPDQFAHVVQRLRDDREESQLFDQRTAQLRAAGVKVIDPELTEGARQLGLLRPRAGDRSGTELSAEAHAQCPGHAASVMVRRVYGAADEPRRRAESTYWCLDPDTHGHVQRWDRPSPPSTLPGAQPRPAGPRTEAEKRERRDVIANNKAWDSAVTVRRRWTTQFLARKNPPKDAAGFIASALAWGCHDVRRAMELGNRAACTLLGLPEPPGYNSSQPNPLIEAAAAASGPRAVQVSLAVLLGGFEEGTSRNSWRSPTRATRAYFEQLQAWGYSLSQVEQRILSGDSGDSSAEAGIEPAGETSEPDPSGDEPRGAEPSGADQDRPSRL